MPIRALQSLRACLGRRPTQNVNVQTNSGTSHINSYQPSRHYSVSELNQFATSNLPSASNRLHFLADLARSILLSDTSRPDKALLCKHLANLITDQDTVDFQGAPRQANFFASYCIDLSLQELEHQYTAVAEQNLRSMLTLWVNTLCPAQNEFNLNGVVYSRTEIQDMLSAPGLISRKVQQTRSNLGIAVERRLYGESIELNAQNVHDPSVRANAARVLGIMRAKYGSAKEPTQSEVSLFVNRAASNTPSRPTILAGMTHCLNHIGHDSNWEVSLTPNKALKEVIRYIKATPDVQMKTNLTNALLERLREISAEKPCVVGVLQRLMDVPNGIDPDMNFAGVSRQIEEDMSRLAVKTYAQVNSLIDESIQAQRALPDSENNEANAEAIASKIGKEMFGTRVKQDMHLLGGLNQAELTPHFERLKAGF